MLIWIAEQKFWNLIFPKSFAEDEWHTPAGKQSHQKPPLPPTTSPRGASTSSSLEPMSPSNDSLEPVQTLSRFWRHQWILSYPLTPQVKQYRHPDSQNKSQDPGLLFLLWFSPACSPAISPVILSSCYFPGLLWRGSLVLRGKPLRCARQGGAPERGEDDEEEVDDGGDDSIGHKVEKLRKELEGKNKTESRFEVLPNIICIYSNKNIIWIWGASYCISNFHCFALLLIWPQTPHWQSQYTHRCREREKWRVKSRQMLMGPTYLDTLLETFEMSGKDKKP